MQLYVFMYYVMLYGINFVSICGWVKCEVEFIFSLILYNVYKRWVLHPKLKPSLRPNVCVCEKNVCLSACVRTHICVKLCLGVSRGGTEEGVRNPSGLPLTGLRTLLYTDKMIPFIMSLLFHVTTPAYCRRREADQALVVCIFDILSQCLKWVTDEC